MRGKLVLLVGVGIGYVFGARAGRERYEDIKRCASRFWNSPRVQGQVQQAQDFARDKAPDVVGFLGDQAKKVVSRPGGGSARGSAARAGAEETASGTAAAKEAASKKIAPGKAAPKRATTKGSEASK